MDAWKFPGYEKIAENLERWKLGPEEHRALSRTPWVVTEKIHGANFCLATDGAEVRCGNRRAWLTESEAASFFGGRDVRDALAPALRDLFARLHAAHAEIARLYVYGELFGGGYPHPEVPIAPGVQPVQTGVWYAPDVRFCAFDLRQEDAAGDRRYIDYAEALERFRASGIFCAEPLFVGGYEAATNHPNRFDSTLPRRLGLPPLPAGTNLAEGVVIKPYREIELRGVSGDLLRPVVKRKIPEFAEDRRFHEAEKWTESSPIIADALPLELLKWEAYNRVTRNRRDAVASKIGPGDARRSHDSLLFTLLVSEIMDEARAAVPDSWAVLSSDQRADLTLYVQGEVRTLLRAFARERP